MTTTLTQTASPHLQSVLERVKQARPTETRGRVVQLIGLEAAPSNSLNGSPCATDGVDAGIQRGRYFAVRPTFSAADASALSRILAFVISCADRLPELISASSRSRSSALNFTTYFFAPVLCPCHESLPSSPRRRRHRNSEMPPSFKDASD